MKDYLITCLCGAGHQINFNEEVTCPCGVVLTIRATGRKSVTPFARIDEDSAVERKKAGKPVRNMNPSLRYIGRVR